ncbi:MAG: hypothetical protein ACRCXT_06910 [Paraclostridium sp.]
MNELFNLINEYLNNNIAPGEFILEFEETFLELEDEVHDKNINLYDLLDNIRIACAHYEDNEEIRKQCDSYINIKQFYKEVEKNYMEISKITLA